MSVSKTPMALTGTMTRRRFMALSSAAIAGVMTGCAVNPVTGEQQLMLMSEDQEIQIDRQNSPRQFSSDYGLTDDRQLAAYIDSTGQRLARVTHRPHMPYSFKVVNAVYVNAYAFPGGSIATTRGVLLSLENEAELAALLGHELGHVNARHTAAQMSSAMLSQAVVGGLAAVVSTQSSGYGQLASQIGQLGAGAFLASYSRDNEREADSLGMAYMTKAGYGSRGFVGLMDMLNNLSRQKPNAIELMFATHPMSDERYRTAVAMARGQYQSTENGPLYRERYMDNTARLRAIKDAIENMQTAEKELAQNRYPSAEGHLKKALARVPDDYAGLLLMAKCQLAQQRYEEAKRYAEAARRVYPGEAQAPHISGFANLKTNRFSEAFQDFRRSDTLLPGNPNLAFLQGYALEQMGRKTDAASYYYRYLQSVNKGDQASYAYKRLVSWGVIKK